MFLKLSSYSHLNIAKVIRSLIFFLQNGGPSFVIEKITGFGRHSSIIGDAMM